MITRSAVFPRLRNRNGAMLILVAVALVGLLGMLAMTLDFGAGTRQRRIAQTAADAGAIGGATQIYRAMDSATVVAAAKNSAIRNFFVASEITVNYPPLSGSHAADKQFVEVIVNRTIPTIFGSVLNKASLDIRARAVAGLGSVSNFCVYALGNSGNNIDIPGDVTTNCGVVSNASIDVKKGIDGNPTPVVAAVGSVSGGPPGNSYGGIPPVPDPYSYLTVPPETICNYTNFTVSGTVTLSPGVYCGGITIGKNDTGIFSKGTYILRGGGLTGGHVIGTEVTIINTNGPGNNIAAFRPITFDNACTLSLTAPLSGPYKGIVIFQDPAGPAAPAANTVNEVCGKGSNPYDIVGVVYFPTQTFNLGNSNGKLSISGALVAKNITGQNGGGKYTFNTDPTGNSSPKRSSLIE